MEWGCSIAIMLFAKYESRVIPVWIMIVLSIGLMLPAALLMLAPIKCEYGDIVLSNDDITVVKGFIFKRHWKFSSIVICKISWYETGLGVYITVEKEGSFLKYHVVLKAKYFIDRNGIRKA